MIRTNNLWAPLVMSGRTPWIIWTCVRSTRRDAKAAYLEGFPASYHEQHLARIRFIRVYVAEQSIKGKS